MIKPIFLILLFCLGASKNINSQNIRFKKNYDNVEYVDNKTTKVEDQLNHAKAPFDWKGIMNVKIKTIHFGLLKDETTALVSVDSNSNGMITITNQAPTGEGMFELGIKIHNKTYTPTLKYSIGQIDMPFKIIRSKVIMNSNAGRIVCVKVKCKGFREKKGNIYIKNWFYFTVK